MMQITWRLSDEVKDWEHLMQPAVSLNSKWVAISTTERGVRAHMNHLPIKCRPSGDLQITMKRKKCRRKLGRAIWELAIAWKWIACVDLSKDAKAFRCKCRNASTGLLIWRQSDEMQMITTPIEGWRESCHVMSSSLMWEPQKLVIARAVNWSLLKWELQRWSSGRKSAVYV